MTLPNKVRIIEVGPRDGLQNEKKFLESGEKIAFINELSNTGLQDIEVTSFVSKRAIPQLQDAETVFTKINKKPNTNYFALVPNLQGLQKALASGVTHIALFSASSNTFTEKNIGCSVGESLKRNEAIFRALEAHPKVHVRAYLSCVVACPYEGKQAPSTVAKLASVFFEMGAHEISLGDTIGVATPKQTELLLHEVLKSIPMTKIGMHFHNTYGQALANVFQSLLLGISTFDSSVAGLGGCPYAFGASGNLATEDLVYLCQGLGIETGIDLHALAKIGERLSKILGRPNQSNAATAVLSKTS